MRTLLACLAVAATFLPRLLWADTVVVFNEVNYHPATNESALEWVELRNQMAVDVDISGWSVGGGIQFSFASNTIVRGGGYVLVALSPGALTNTLGPTNVLGPFTGRLSNDGDALELRDNSGRLRDRMSYGVEDDWPVPPDGAGVTLAKLDRDTASGPAENWTWSEQIGGTPLADNFPLVGVVPPDVQFATTESAWKYEASGADLGATWREPAFSDAAWSTGTSWFYHGAITVGETRPVATLFSTGIGTNGAALAPGAADPHYTITAAAQGTVGAPATAMQNNAAWLGNNPQSTWVGVVSSGDTSISAGSYNFLTRFVLSGFVPGSVQINLSLAADDRCTNVFLNGTPTGISLVGFAAFTSSMLSSGFVAGTNTLEFRTVNDGANPGGFRAQLSGSGTVVITNTALPAGPATYYFRKAFNFTGDPVNTILRLNAIVDDGAVFYLNGVEVQRVNMPGGAISHGTPALSAVTAPAYTGLMAIPAASLVAGTNVLAVEVHQAAGDTSDMLFGAELIATPVVPPPLTLAFNEVASSTNGPFFVELVNHGTNAIPLDGYVVAHDGDGNNDHQYVIPASTTLAGGAYLALTNTTLGFLPESGDKLLLYAPGRARVYDGVVVKKTLRGRSPNGTGPWLFPNLPTPGAPNSFAFRNEIVINEIMYHHKLLPPVGGLPPEDSHEAWLELFNKGASPVDLTGWELTGGISYRFTPGKILAPGAYLVVADDAAALRVTYPAIDIVGDFGGRLSHNSDRIVLMDPSGNPADEVRYFDGGRWPDYADGGGSSLELRDPNADNSKAEAWAASDETDQSSWQNFSYTNVANFISGTQPTTWSDFVFGLLSGGECLIDDISVTWSNSASSIVANGNFDSGLTGWRVLGNHNRTRLDTDPGNPGNNVLRVVATGPQEHMHNHIEATLVAGRTITNGQPYTVSFRAKWLAGNPWLNTRLYFNRVARTTYLPSSAFNGTPGAQNSHFTTNIGPTFAGFGHLPVIPAAGQAVTVSVTAQDPQGVSACHVWWSTNGTTFSSAAMTHQGGGRYAGTIQGYPAGAVVQFYVRAVDGLGAMATYPAEGPASGALYAVADGQANLSLGHNLRIMLTPGNVSLLHASTNVMSNDNLPCTVIVDEKRAYYDMGVRLKSSQRGRDNAVRVGFHLDFPPDDLFRGVHPVMLTDRSPGGSSPAQEEIVLRHMLLRAGGIPGTQADMSRVIAPRPAQTGPCIFSPRFEDEFIDTAFENGGDGTLFELELIYFPLSTLAGTSYKLPQPDDVVQVDYQDLGNDKEAYRYNFIIKNHRDTDDYTGFIPMAKAFSLSGAPLETQAQQLLDVDQWLRAYALVSLCSVGDMYTFGIAHNWMLYQRPSDGKFLYFPWDMDFSFTGGETRALIGGQNFAKIVNLPANRRCFYAHVLDIIGTSFNAGYMTYWLNHYDNFAPGQNYTGRATFIQNRITSAINEINANGGNAAFAITGTNVITTSNSLVTLVGTAPVQAKTIRINGVEYPVTWTSVSGWTLRVPVSAASNFLSVVGYDLRDQPLTNLTRTVAVHYTGPAPDPEGAIVINEIMYNPLFPNAAFVELLNTSTNFTFDLAGWRLNGLDFTFPPGSYISNRQHLVVAGQMPAYAAAYGTNAPMPLGIFPGNLQNDGETITLLRPVSTNEVIADQVRYESVPAWPTAANGAGQSLQLIDPRQDNTRVGNWSGGTGWRFVSFTGNPGANATNFIFFLTAPGDLYIDDLQIVAGSVAGVGPNLITNGNFETGLLSPWRAAGNHSNSTVSADVAHEGGYSLHMIANGIGGVASFVGQAMALLPAATPHTCSFWYLASSNGTGFRWRVNNFFQAATPIDYRPAPPTPGQTNSVAATLPPFPAVWLNEVQPENLTGPMDTEGNREPWIELYNAGPTAVDLSGYALADNYSNLVQSPFLPGAMLQPGEFKIVFADGEPGETTPTEWHTSFRLQSGTGSVVLSWPASGAPEVLDYFNYSLIPAGRSYGAFPDGQAIFRQEFFRVTPGGTNDNAPPPLVAYINEWMASNTRTLLNTNNGNVYDDWFELHNPGNNPVSLDGYYLTDNLLNRFQFAIPNGFTIPAQGYLLVWADNKPSANNTNVAELHTNFRLSLDGEAIGLFAGDGTMIDAVNFGQQYSDISEGRFPNGTGPIYYLATPTPRGPNSSWANLPPMLNFIPDATLSVGQPFSFTAVGTDADQPPQMLTFTLDAGAPTNATIHPVSGLFSWTPTVATTNLITVRVRDNGTPPLSRAQTFRVAAINAPRLSGITRQLNGDIELRFNAVVGRMYRVEFKNDLNDAMWQPLDMDFTAGMSTITITDNLGSLPQRFYRLVELQ